MKKTACVHNLERPRSHGSSGCRLPLNLLPVHRAPVSALHSAGPITLLLSLAALLSTAALAPAQEPLKFSGDFRLRHERTTKQEPGAAPDIRDPRNREVVRFRLGMTKKINGLFNFGARLATGSPDDPNTTDVTLGDFVNDLNISLERAYMELNYKNLFLTGGKFANPFRTTEMVWDGDVGIQGFGASYTLTGSARIVPKITGAYYVIDEQTNRPDSYMLGGQVQFSIKASEKLSLTLAGAYYDHSIKSLANANSGDTQSNFLNAAGDAYLSDFDLLNGIVAIEYRGLGERFPLRVVGDYVKNRGDVSGEDEGFNAEFYAGRVSKRGDWRFQYGYTLVENDAVLAAFSHDNTTLATNYEQHTLGVDFVVAENTILNVTLYHYRRHHLKSSIPLENDYFTRLRLNALVNF